MIKAAYCSKELCLLLEKKGIDASHVRQYEKGGSWYNKYTLDVAMRWLREVHNLHIEPHYNRYGSVYKYQIIYKPVVLDDINSQFVFYKYEEAVEASLKYVLENLI